MRSMKTVRNTTSMEGLRFMFKINAVSLAVKTGESNVLARKRRHKLGGGGNVALPRRREMARRGKTSSQPVTLPVFVSRHDF